MRPTPIDVYGLPAPRRIVASNDDLFQSTPKKVAVTIASSDGYSSNRNRSLLEARPLNDSEEVHIEVDGELLGMLPAVYEVVPNALRVRVPQPHGRRK